VISALWQSSLCVAILTLGMEMAPAQDWPEFRGVNRSGASTATGLPVHFGSHENVSWSAEVPHGRSSAIITGKRLFLSASGGEDLLILAFDTQTGRRLWRYSIRRTRRNEIDDVRNDPASPTPATDGQAVYAFFHDFGVVALTLDGKELWKLALGPFPNNYGMGSSPIIHGESLFLQFDQLQGSQIISVDKRTGKLRWRANRPRVLEGWATPLVLPEVGELVSLSSSGVEAFDMETGVLKWTLPASDGIMIPTPITDGRILIATVRGSDQPTFPNWEETIKELDADKDGKLTPSEISKRYNIASFGIADSNRDGYIVQEEWNRFRNRGVGEFGITAIRVADKTVMWRYKRGLPYVPSPILYQGVVYSVRSGGIVTAINAETGQLLKEGRTPEALGDYFASPVAGDGMIYLANSEGKVTVLKADPQWLVLASNDLEDGIAASPAIADGAIFIRTRLRLYCFRQK
jgi:outer membrane protein assembly factor BamB